MGKILGQETSDPQTKLVPYAYGYKHGPTTNGLCTESLSLICMVVTAIGVDLFSRLGGGVIGVPCEGAATDAGGGCGRGDTSLPR